MTSHEWQHVQEASRRVRSHWSGSPTVGIVLGTGLGALAREIETEAAYSMVKQLAREEGLLVGISAAAAVVASVQIAREEAEAGRNAVIVTILPDSADKYLSERFWEE